LTPSLGVEAFSLEIHNSVMAVVEVWWECQWVAEKEPGAG